MFLSISNMFNTHATLKKSLQSGDFSHFICVYAKFFVILRRKIDLFTDMEFFGYRKLVAYVRITIN